MSKSFIGLCLTRPNFINQALQYQQGTVYERMAVSPEDILSMTIKIPSVEEQEKFSRHVSLIEALIGANQAALDSLTKIKVSLLSRIFI